jgi:hypothetical protein
MCLAPCAQTNAAPHALFHHSVSLHHVHAMTQHCMHLSVVMTSPIPQERCVIWDYPFSWFSLLLTFSPILCSDFLIVSQHYHTQYFLFLNLVHCFLICLRMCTHTTFGQSMPHIQQEKWATIRNRWENTGTQWQLWTNTDHLYLWNTDGNQQCRRTNPDYRLPLLCWLTEHRLQWAMLLQHPGGSGWSLHRELRADLVTRMDDIQDWDPLSDTPGHLAGKSQWVWWEDDTWTIHIPYWTHQQTTWICWMRRRGYIRCKTEWRR